MTALELDVILTTRWPTLVRRVMADLNADDFAKGFARSIARHGKRPEWMPTEKQERIMHQLLDQYSAAPEADLVLIEKD